MKGFYMDEEKTNSLTEDELKSAKYILENQQKEMRAYDNKASAYIASNSGLFVVAIFTLCVFVMISDNKNCKYIPPYGYKWWILFITTLVYVMLFVISNSFALLVLFPRTKGIKDSSLNEYNDHITNFVSEKTMSDLDKSLNKTIDKFDQVIKEHIKANIKTLRKKHFYSIPIIYLSIAMGIFLIVSIVLIFVL